MVVQALKQSSLRILWVATALVGFGAGALGWAGTRAPGADADPKRKPLLIRNVHLLPMAPVDGGLRGRYSVLIQGGIITRIAPDGEIPVPHNSTVIDGQGKYLLPGLIDVHVHIWDTPELSAYLVSGVTTVRNASGMPFHLEYSAAITAGDLEGPRLITTGPILRYGPESLARLRRQAATTSYARSRQQILSGLKAQGTPWP